MKKVGLLISQLRAGGAERVVSRLSFILGEQYEIYVILFEDTFMDYECHGTIINLGIKSTSDSLLKKIFLVGNRLIKMKEVKRQLELDAVISFMESPNVVNILSHTSQCQTIISIRNSRPDSANSLIISLIKYLYRKADWVFTVSKLITADMINDYGIEGERTLTIYNPFDLESIQKLAGEQLEPRYQEFFGDEATVFITVGRHDYQKGFWHLIKSFKRVHQKDNYAKLVIVGNDNQAGKVRRLIEELQLSEHVLLAGYQSNPFKFMARSTVYVLSSLFEGFPNAVVEAMACGCVVVAADCKTGPREILYDEADLDKIAKDIEYADYGILVPPMEPGEDWNADVLTSAESKLAEAMIICLGDAELKEKYGPAAMRRAGFFSYEKCRKQYMKVLG